jgi:shikimate dehydrogenase
MLTFALYGRPVSGSLSPAMHNAAFAAAGLEARYEAVDVAPGDLEDAFRRAVRSGFGGLNLTVPHKVAGMAFCDELSSGARLAGAVNTVVFHGGKAFGYNTDVSAMEQVIKRWLVNRAGRPPRGPRSSPRAPGFRVAVLGAGGAARAAALAAAGTGASLVALSGRTRETAERTAADLQANLGTSTLGPSTAFEAFAVSDLLADLDRYDVIVQATSAPDGALSLSPPGRPGAWRGKLAVEFNYRPVLTRFLAAAAGAGATTVDGLELLWRQGEEAYRLFTGSLPPPGVMWAALEAALGKGGAGSCRAC